MKIIDFPEVRQSRNYTCGVACLQALLYFYGISYREDELEHLLGTTPQRGTSPSQIIQLCQQFGFHVQTKQHMTLEDIRFHLNHNQPILVVYQAWRNTQNPSDYQNDWSDGHYSIIVGLDHDRLIMNDPALIGRGYLPINEFMTRWHDSDADGHLYVRYGLVLMGRTIKYRPQIIHRIL